MRRVLVVGGSREFTGAPYLAGIAALRSGAESVIVMAPEKVAWAINALSPDLITRKLRGEYLSSAHRAHVLKQLKTANVLVVGNGATTQAGPSALMRSLMETPVPKVVDADALKVLRGNAVSNAILTPNEGEWKLLERHSDIRELLSRGNVIIKKGVHTEILSAGKRRLMSRVNSGLSKAGMGDVLAGMCAAYLSEGLSLFDAAVQATAQGNAVADVLTKKKKGYYFLASDLAGELVRSKKHIR